jgi:AcrR family transcriptional regulator
MSDESSTPADRPVTDRRRRELVQAAYNRIASQGFEGLRTRDVAADAGVNIATLHYYFPTKEALIRGVVTHALRQFSGTLPQDGSSRDQLRAHLAAVANLVKTNRELFSVLAELSLRAPRNEAIASVVGNADDVWEATLVRLMERGKEDASFAADFDSEGAAALIVAAVKGVGLPTMAAFHPSKVDQVFAQLRQLLDM